jgi:hypothetical protein
MGVSAEEDRKGLLDLQPMGSAILSKNPWKTVANNRFTSFTFDKRITDNNERLWIVNPSVICEEANIVPR